MKGKGKDGKPSFTIGGSYYGGAQKKKKRKHKEEGRGQGMVLGLAGTWHFKREEARPIEIEQENVSRWREQAGGGGFLSFFLIAPSSRKAQKAKKKNTD